MLIKTLFQLDAPKFPTPVIFNFLHTFYALKRPTFVTADLQSMNEDTLKHLASASKLTGFDSMDKKSLVKHLQKHVEHTKALTNHALHMSIFSLNVRKHKKAQ
jgi:hypothetical protein